MVSKYEHSDNDFEQLDDEEESAVQAIIPNQDYSLLSVIRNGSVNFYDTSNLKEYADNLGDNLSNISICLPYQRSEIVYIVGNKSNMSFPFDKVIIYNLETKAQIADIQLNLEEEEVVEKLYATIRNLFIVLTHKILLFDILSLKYITTFHDVKGKRGKVSFSSMKTLELTPETTLAYISNLNHNNIKILKLKYLNEQLVMSQQLIATDLEGIQFISISSQCKFIAAVSLNGEKINIYSLRTYKARNYLWRGKTKVSIVDVVFDPTDRFMCLFSLQKTFHFYPLLNKYLNSRAKKEHNATDEDDYYQYGVNKPRRTKDRGPFASDKRKYKDSHAQFKDKQLLKDEIVLFYLNDKSDLVVFNKVGKVLSIKMNKRLGGMCTLIHSKDLKSSDL